MDLRDEESAFCSCVVHLDGSTINKLLPPEPLTPPAFTAFQHSILAFPCIILNLLIQHCYPFLSLFILSLEVPPTDGSSGVEPYLHYSLALIVVGPPTDANTVPALTYLESTLMKPPVSVAIKELTGSLNPLDATLTKNKGVGVSVMVNQKSNKNHCSERPSGARIDLPPTMSGSRIKSYLSVCCRLPARMLRFGVP